VVFALYFHHLGAFFAAKSQTRQARKKPGFPLQFLSPMLGLAGFPLQSLSRQQFYFWRYM
jgi:hypothetical protein